MTEHFTQPAGGSPAASGQSAITAALVEQVRDYAIIGLDPHGVVVSWNQGAEAVKGYLAEEIIGSHFSVFYPDQDRRAGLPAALLERARHEGRVEHTGWRVRKDGSQFWGDVVITALRDDDGTLIGYGKVTRDLTEQHRLEQDLRSSEERFRLLVSQVIDYAIIALDPHGIIESWNAGAEQVKGYEPGEILGKHFSVFYADEDRRAGLPLRLLDEARSLGRVEHTGWRVRKDGSRFWADVIITALRNEEGQLTGYAKVTRDLTEQHRLEQSLRTSEERFRVLVSQVLDYAIIALDAQGIVETWNAGAEQVKGYLADEIIGKHFSVFYTDEDRRAGLPLRLLDEARAYGRVEHTGWRVRKDGTRFWGDVVITALHDDRGRLTGFGKVTRDLTEHVSLEAARESFFRGISHDLKTPLAALKGFASILADDQDPDQRRQVAARLEANVDRLTAMVNELVEHAQLRAGTVPMTLERVALADLVEDAASNLGPLLAAPRPRGHRRPRRDRRRPPPPRATGHQPADERREVLPRGVADPGRDHLGRASGQDGGRRPGPRHQQRGPPGHLRRVPARFPRRERRRHGPRAVQRQAGGDPAPRRGVDRQRGRSGHRGHGRPPAAAGLTPRCSVQQGLEAHEDDAEQPCHHGHDETVDETEAAPMSHAPAREGQQDRARDQRAQDAGVEVESEHAEEQQHGERDEAGRHDLPPRGELGTGVGPRGPLALVDPLGDEPGVPFGAPVDDQGDQNRDGEPGRGGRVRGDHDARADDEAVDPRCRALDGRAAGSVVSPVQQA